MLTITISARALLLAAFLVIGALSAIYATAALGSGGNLDSILQGDTDCDGDVDAADALHNLRYAGELPVPTFGICPQVGTEAAIPGPTGPAGPAGVSGLEVVQQSLQPAGPANGFSVQCPSGKQSLGGGVWSDLPALQSAVVASFPYTVDEQPVGWFGHIRNDTGNADPWMMTVYAICALVSE